DGVAERPGPLGAAGCRIGELVAVADAVAVLRRGEREAVADRREADHPLGVEAVAAALELRERRVREVADRDRSRPLGPDGRAPGDGRARRRGRREAGAQLPGRYRVRAGDADP